MKFTQRIGFTRQVLWSSTWLIFVGSLLGWLVFSKAPVHAQAQAQQPNSPLPFTVFATGLDNPRGLKFGPDGDLYVAEGGLGGDTSTVGQCPQAGPEIGPYTGGNTARISKIDKQGARTTVADHLPSTQDIMGSIVGVSDIAFLDEQLYALIGGAGCSHGHPETDNGVYRVNDDGTLTLVADLSAFIKANPVAQPDAADFEPDGSFYSIIAWDDNLYVVEANGGQLLKVTPHGQVTRIVDFSARYGHIVPTVVTVRNDQFYVGNLGEFDPTASKPGIYRVRHNGRTREVVANLSSILGILYDRRSRLFVLEPFANGGLAPGAGQILQITPRTQQTTTITVGLTFPTGMTRQRHGDIYVSNKGFGFPEGQGEIVRIHLPDEDDEVADASAIDDFDALADPDTSALQPQIFLPLIQQ